MKIVAKTFEGLEPVLQKEMEDLRFSNIEVLKRAVSFEGELQDLYLANYMLRTALRILVPVLDFRASNETQLYQKVFDYNWSDHLHWKQTLAIDSNVNSPIFRHSKYVALKVKDAIVDKFRSRTGRRPSVDTEYPDLQLNVRVFRDRVTVSLDSSGFSLHRRGYRLESYAAPLNEVLAAGMVQLTNYDRNQTFLDPMCGSGTLLMEAAMLGNRVPPGILIRNYGFQKWNDYDSAIWKSILKERIGNIQKDNLPIFGSDISFQAYTLSNSILKKHAFSRHIKIAKKGFSSYNIHSEKGTIIMNPPYDMRMKTGEIISFYKMIGDTLKNKYAGWTAWIFSGNLDAIKHIGLRASRRISLNNGAIPCKLLKFDLYEGSKKIKSQYSD